jgi:hypothetical protein
VSSPGGGSSPEKEEPMKKEEQEFQLDRYRKTMTKNKIPEIVQKANIKNMKHWLSSGKKNQEDYALSVIDSSEQNFNRKKERKKATYDRKTW